VLTTKGIDDLVLKLFIEKGAMAVRRCKKEDLRRIAKATGATLISSLSDLNAMRIRGIFVRHAEEVVQERISDDECILVKGTKVHTSASIILRGPNDYQLDEMERSVHDSLSASSERLKVVALFRVEERSKRLFTSTSRNLLALLLKRAACDRGVRSTLLIIPKLSLSTQLKTLPSWLPNFDPDMPFHSAFRM